MKTRVGNGYDTTIVAQKTANEMSLWLNISQWVFFAWCSAAKRWKFKIFELSLRRVEDHLATEKRSPYLGCVFFCGFAAQKFEYFRTGDAFKSKRILTKSSKVFQNVKITSQPERVFSNCLICLIVIYPVIFVIRYWKRLRFNTSNSIFHSTSYLATAHLCCCTIYIRIYEWFSQFSPNCTPSNSNPGDRNVTIASSFG